MFNPFNKSKKAFGLEISDFSLKALWFNQKRQGLTVAGYNRLDLPKGLVVEGEIKKSDEVANLLQQLVEEAKPQKIAIPRVISSLPENKTFVRIIEIPKMTQQEISEAVRWEAEHHIPLSISDVYLDWQILSEKDSKIKLLLAAADKKLVEGYVDTLEKAKLSPQALELEAAAEGRTLIKENETTKQTYLIVDIGATKTMFSILSSEVIYFSSSITKVSGNFFTKTIADCLNAKKEEAEKTKVACCSPQISEKEQAVLDAIHPAFDELAKEIEKIEHYFFYNFDQTSDKINVILCGGGAGLFGIAPYLSLKLKQKVRLGDPWLNVPLTEHPPLALAQALGYTQVIGLALRGIRPNEYTTQL
ncbi:type IV pilus assembly protein PilM [Patescibacteria group bacterium]|nr:type IV pilus assembly protein PilM [Patescibacteria group bacterium]